MGLQDNVFLNHRRERQQGTRSTDLGLTFMVMCFGSLFTCYPIAFFVVVFFLHSYMHVGSNEYLTKGPTFEKAVKFDSLKEKCLLMRINIWNSSS